MENEFDTDITDVEEKPNEGPNLVLIIGGLGLVAACLCVVLPIVVIAVLALMGPAIGNVFSDILDDIEVTPEFEDSSEGFIPEEVESFDTFSPEVISVPDQGLNHVEIGEPHEPYNSDPPTSGPHYPIWVEEAGLYTEIIEDEYIVHNLEHGYVIIWYNCDGMDNADCQALQDDIEELIASFDYHKIIGMPRPGMETTLALTSWTKLARLDSFNEDFMVEFILTYRDQSPEPNAP